MPSAFAVLARGGPPSSPSKLRRQSLAKGRRPPRGMRSNPAQSRGNVLIARRASLGQGQTTGNDEARPANERVLLPRQDQTRRRGVRTKQPPRGRKEPNEKLGLSPLLAAFKGKLGAPRVPTVVVRVRALSLDKARKIFEFFGERETTLWFFWSYAMHTGTYMRYVRVNPKQFLGP